jgi:hypothetical protein
VAVEKGFTNLKFQIVSSKRLLLSALLALGTVGAAALPLILEAQDRPSATIIEDCNTFAVSANNRIVYSVPHMKRVKHIIIERDDVSVADLIGKGKIIVERDKFMPVPPPVTYVVNGLTWAPDGRHIAMTMTTISAEGDDKGSDDDNDTGNPQQDSQRIAMPSNGKKVVALLDDEGHEVKVGGSKTRFIENASNGAWLADGQTAVYLTGINPYKIVRVRLSDGQSSTLFEEHTFDAVVWDAARNEAFAVSQNLSISGKTALMQLDLIHEGVREITRLPNFQGQLTVSASGKRVGYFMDGDTIEVRDLASPLKFVRVRTGPGKFEFSHDDQRILLKRGPVDKSGSLVWVGLADNSFTPILHGLEFHDFEITPDGNTVIVMDPGKGILKIYPLR